MKCPKCGYLGFESVERCRNCGYEFSLAPAQVRELTLAGPSTSSPDALDDLGFVSEGSGTASSPPSSAPDLPLFSPAASVDEPLITKASPPRQPLAVRRATSELPRSRAEPRSQSFDLALDADPRFKPSTSTAVSTVESMVGGPANSANMDAGLGARLLAALIDLVILALVDAAVLYFTAEICGVGFRDIGVLPKGPLLLFLLAQNGGYFVVFTAGGQTIGKMVMGIRVVAAEESQPLDFARAARRTLVWVALAIPAGLGFVTTLFTHDHRGLHDRIAGTRVIRASA